MAVDMQNKSLVSLLRKLMACPEAVKWVGERGLKTAWAKCERADWMLWLVGKMADTDGWPTRREVVLAVCACAETALRYVPSGELRPKQAIETARRWAEGKGTLDEVRAAADAAYAAYAAYAAHAAAAHAAAAHAAANAAYAAAHAAHAAYAAYAAYAAAYAAYAADAAAYAADATDAAYAADAADDARTIARTKALKQLADVVRNELKGKVTHDS